MSSDTSASVPKCLWTLWHWYWYSLIPKCPVTQLTMPSNKRCYIAWRKQWPKYKPLWDKWSKRICIEKLFMSHLSLQRDLALEPGKMLSRLRLDLWCLVKVMPLHCAFCSAWPYFWCYGLESVLYLVPHLGSRHFLVLCFMLVLYLLGCLNMQHLQQQEEEALTLLNE